MKYTAPEMKVVMFETEEVIVASVVAPECPEDYETPGGEVD